MNYKYHLIGKDYILTKQEHEKVSTLQKSGTSIIYLRNGNLMINMAFVGAINETDDLTVIQEGERQQILALSPDQRPKQNFFPLSEKPQGGGFVKVLAGNSMKACTVCEEIHFIPENKTHCLLCLKKSKKI